MRLRRVFLWTMIVSLSLAAAMGIVAILFPGFGQTQERILITSLVVGAFSLPALACSIVLSKRRLVWLMWIGIGCTLASILLWLVLIWTDAWMWNENVEWDELIAKTGFTLTFVAILASATGLLSLLRLNRPAFRSVRLATILVASVLAALGSLAIWAEIDEDWMGKTIGILSILATCGTIVTPVLGLIEHLQRRGSRESIPTSVKIDLTCPRCRTHQTLPAGAARCIKCGLRIDIDVEEPRCECGYLLYQLQTDRCPECGKAITDWSARDEHGSVTA
jgi:hypothetical protein